MSTDLYAWKGPIVSEDDARRLVERFNGEGDTDAFEASDDVRRFYDELLAKDRDVEAESADRVVDALAQKHDLVLYDPQGPSFHSPKELLVEPVRRDPAELRQALIGLLIGVVLVVGGWIVPLPVLNWIAIVIGVFIVVMAVYSVGAWLKE